MKPILKMIFFAVVFMSSLNTFGQDYYTSKINEALKQKNYEAAKVYYDLYKNQNGKSLTIEQQLKDYEVRVQGPLLDTLRKRYDELFDVGENLYKVKQKGKYGLVNKTTGSEVVPPKYDFMGYSFAENEGVLKVGLNNSVRSFGAINYRKFGFIDEAGKAIIPVMYDDAGDVQEGLIWVKFNGKYGFLDKEGNMIIAIQYDVIGEKYAILYKMSESKKGNVTTFREPELQIFPGLATTTIQTFNGTVEIASSGVSSIIIPSGFSEGEVWVKLNGKTFMIDKTGKNLFDKTGK